MAAVFTPLTKSDMDHIARSYILGDVESFDGVADGSVNTIYYLNTAKGEFFLRLEEIKPEKVLAQEVKFLRFLAEKNLGVAIPLMVPLHGRTDFILNYQGKSLLMFKRVAGRSLLFPEFGPKHLAQIGTWLGKFHVAAQGFSQEIPNRFDLPGLQALFDQARPILLQKEDGALAPFVLGLEEEFAFQKSNFKLWEQLPWGVTHGDVFPDNLMFEGDTLASVLDFDSAATTPIIFDLATAFHALAFKGQTFLIDRCQTFLAAYEAARPLDSAEKSLFNLIMRFSALRFTMTRIKDFYLREAGESGLIDRDFRDFYRRLEFVKRLDGKSFLDLLK